jgi:cholesterol transport system auxiliary component
MSRSLTRAAAGGLGALALLVTPGCISLLPASEPDTLYRLTIAEGDPAVTSSGSETVIIGRIAAPRGLAGDRIALEREGAIAYMAGAAWLSPAPSMLYSAVVDTLHAQAPALTPARAEDGVRSDYELDLELRHFEAVYDNGQNAAPLIRASLRARLIDRRSRTLIGARTLDATQRASANRQGRIVEAFSLASADMAAALASWTEAQVCAADDAPQACSP